MGHNSRRDKLYNVIYIYIGRSSHHPSTTCILISHFLMPPGCLAHSTKVLNQQVHSMNQVFSSGSGKQKWMWKAQLFVQFEHIETYQDISATDGRLWVDLTVRTAIQQYTIYCNLATFCTRVICQSHLATLRFTLVSRMSEMKLT